MPERMTIGKRIRLQNVAEREIKRFAGNHALWHKHVHNVELDPVQALKMIEMDEHRFTVDFSCRRTGKTAVKELWLLEHGATHSDQELGIVAPREAQARVNLGYHHEAIRRSEILTAYLGHKSGRTQMADTYYEFVNRSKAQAYGVMANVDGGDLTCASLEEVDDMPRERLFSRFLLMMGATRRLGASKESRNDPVIRITGVFKGADTLQELIDGGHFESLTIVNVHLGIEMGILNAAFMADMRDQLSHEEYIRQLLCRNVSARNLIWEKHIRRAMHIGLEVSLNIYEPMPGQSYRHQGLVALGYDHTGHGERPESSRSAVVVLVMIGNFICVLYARTWSPGTDEQVIRRDLVSIWRYFMPDYGFGDAYGIGLMTQVNDDLYAEDLTRIDRRAIGDGESTASTWSEWPFAPLRFEGMLKHQMCTGAASLFKHEHMAIPYVEDSHGLDGVEKDILLLRRQLANIRAEATSKSYASYKMVKPKLGDDLFDAFCAAAWAMITHGQAKAAPVILTSTRSREDLLQLPAVA